MFLIYLSYESIKSNNLVKWQASGDFDTIRKISERNLQLTSGWKRNELVWIIGYDILNCSTIWFGSIESYKEFINTVDIWIEA